jgi:hypothetical protein
MGQIKVVTWDKNLFNYPVGWGNKFLKGIPSHGMGSKNFFVPWDGTIFQIFSSHPIPSHGIAY